ncbi:MAG: ATP-binding cassette domain-containing protein [Alphaproteobacteria bacterium]
MSTAPANGQLMLRGVGLRANGRVLIEPLDLTVDPGQVATVMGPSGCGKSSLLAYICGTLDPGLQAGGQVFLNGMDVTALPPEQRRIGILYQDDLLFPHLSVAENLAFGLPSELRDRAVRQERINAALTETGLAGLGDRNPATLSGGQRARVALLRTLLAQPRALLLDEPFAKLDVGLRARFRRFVFDHVRSNRLPTVLVTHDPADAPACDGPVIQIGLTEEANGGENP